MGKSPIGSEVWVLRRIGVDVPVWEWSSGRLTSKAPTYIPPHREGQQSTPACGSGTWTV